MKILVVDDSKFARKVLISMFKRMNILDVEEAEDGRQAVAMADQFEYDLILLDWNMPEMLGIDALMAIRATGNSVPIIMVTTDSERSNIVDAIQAGANSYVLKPINPPNLIDKIKAIIPAFAD